MASLGHALSEELRVEARALQGDATTPERLVTGLRAVANFLEEILGTGSDDDKAALALWGLDKDTLVALRAQADRVHEAGKVVVRPPKKVSQRALDVQDGRVLLLIERILRAFRLARRADRSIMLPELSRIAWMFDTRSATPGAEEVKPPTPSSGSGSGP